VLAGAAFRLNPVIAAAPDLSTVEAMAAQGARLIAFLKMR